MTKTAVVSRAEDPRCENAQFYVNGEHIGYAKLEAAYIAIVLDALKAAGFEIITT